MTEPYTVVRILKFMILPMALFTGYVVTKYRQNPTSNYWMSNLNTQLSLYWDVKVHSPLLHLNISFLLLNAPSALMHFSQ
jgi:hypothetical protein